MPQRLIILTVPSTVYSNPLVGLIIVHVEPRDFCSEEGLAMRPHGKVRHYMHSYAEVQ